MTDPTETPSGATTPLDDRLSLDDLERQMRPAVDRLEIERQAVRKGMLTRSGAGIGGGVVLALLLSLFGVGLFISIIVFFVGTVGGIAVLVELTELNGRELLKGCETFSLISY